MPGILEKKQKVISPIVGDTLQVVGEYYPEIFADQTETRNLQTSRENKILEHQKKILKTSQGEDKRKGAQSHLETLRLSVQTIEDLFPDLFQEVCENCQERRNF